MPEQHEHVCNKVTPDEMYAATRRRKTPRQGNDARAAFLLHELRFEFIEVQARLRCVDGFPLDTVRLVVDRVNHDFDVKGTQTKPPRPVFEVVCDILFEVCVPFQLKCDNDLRIVVLVSEAEHKLFSAVCLV